jgi:outer membrane receptor for ferrienterochelin and colicin
MFKRLLYLLTFVLAVGHSYAQVTTSSISGFVGSTSEPLIGATITATHRPTGTVYRTQTKAGGKFDLNNLNPGGPYTIVVSYVNFETITRDEVFLALGEISNQEFKLSATGTELTTVVVSAARAAQGRGGTETNIGRDKMANLPTVSRNITDFVRAVPQAKIGTTEGAISIAGQNNRYNAFYIDGALNNDAAGISASGTNGGQANITPISIDAIDQIQVVISPYDPSLSGFTGGGINAITRSGTNDIQASAYYFFRNQNLAGKTPTGSKSAATKFATFQNKTYGFRVGGPIIKNKLFYFFNAEIQRDVRPQPFDISRYSGNTKEAGLNALADTLRKRYSYEPGSYADNPETVNAEKIVAKIDWNINEKNKLSLSHRYNNGERFNTSSSSTSTINFYNNGHVFPTKTHSSSLELRSNFRRSASNKLLLTYVNVLDNRNPIGQNFPRVSITDGSGSIIFGPDASSTVNYLAQKNYALFDVLRFNAGKHSLSFGTDNELNDIYNAFIQNTFGSYQYSNITDFYNNARPSTYNVGYSLIDKTDENTNAAAKFKVLRLGIFAGDEFRPNNNLTLNFGIRADKVTFLDDPATDPFFNDTALAKFSQLYDLEGARSGLNTNIQTSISPRIGFTYKIPDEKVTVRGGVGMFTGRIPLIWLGNPYNSNGVYQGAFTANSQQNPAALNTIRFRPDPDNQYRATDVGVGISKGGLNLNAKDFRLPKVLRTSLAFDKQIGNGWTATVEAMYSKNINETYYRNLNLLPPVGQSKGPGSRTVYPASGTPAIRANGTNPYDNAILLTNAKGDKGYSYNFTFVLDKRFERGFSFNASYNFGDAVVLHEPTSTTSFSQWRFIETVNGRNSVTRSTSDFAQGHRIFAYASKKIEYLRKFMSTTFTLVYNGQSGAPISYVYGSNSAVRDAAVSNGFSSDLVYIPTASDIENMVFLSNTIGSGSSAVTYNAAQQKAALNNFIEASDYLKTRRGNFAERNGDRLPFYHIIDFKIAQDFNLKVSGTKRIQFQVTYDIFNFTNLLNRDWGRTYFASNDQFRFMEFGGYTADLTPQYRFNPLLTQPQSLSNVSTSSSPTYSPRWTSQLGLRVNF